MTAMRIEQAGAKSAWGFDEGEEISPGLHALRLLGGGHRYEAYLAFDEQLQYLVVAKALRPDQANDPSALRSLRREAEILASVSHPVVARLFREELDGDRPLIVLEFVEGPRLSTLVRNFGPIEVDQAAPLGIELASALHSLHESGLVHLDVKPKNVIMGAPPRLIDMSIARTVERAAATTHPIGTDAYMAPEQCVPHAGIPMGPASDVWGLGVTLYDAITARIPFPRGTEDDDAPVEQRFPQLAFDPEPLPPETPAPLQEVIEASLAWDAANRPTPREVAETLRPLLDRPRRLVLNRLRPR